MDGVFHALGDPTRRAIVARLARGPASVSDLAKPLPMSLAADRLGDLLATDDDTTDDEGAGT